MQPENLGREGSPSIMEVSLYFASILQSENKPRVVRFKDLTSSYLLHIAGWLQPRIPGVILTLIFLSSRSKIAR